MKKLRTDWILEWVKGPRVLDVGCTGHEIELESEYWLHGRLQRQYNDVVGVDISERNVAYLRKRGFANVIMQNAESLNIPGKFNTIIAGELIEHLANPGKFLERARNHLYPDGRIILTTPYPFALHYTLYALWKYPQTCQNLEHTCWFCPQTLRILAERCGFEIEHLSLISDYRSEENPSFLYRWLVRAITLFAPILPIRLKHNTMLAVLVPNENFVAQ